MIRFRSSQSISFCRQSYRAVTITWGMTFLRLRRTPLSVIGVERIPFAISKSHAPPTAARIFFRWTRRFVKFVLGEI